MSFQDTDTGAGYGINGNSTTGDGVLGLSDSGPGVSGQSKKAQGVLGNSETSSGVEGKSFKSVGVAGESTQSDGVRGRALIKNRSGVLGTHVADGNGVAGMSQGGNGVFGQSNYHLDKKGSGVFGLANPSGYGVYGYSPDGPVGTIGSSDNGIGVLGQSGKDEQVGVLGVNTADGTGVQGQCDSGTGVAGFSETGHGVAGSSSMGTGVTGASDNSVGVAGRSASFFGSGVSGENTAGGIAVRGAAVQTSGIGIRGDGGGVGVSGEGSIAGVMGDSKIFGVSGSGDWNGVAGEGGVSGVLGTLKGPSILGGVSGFGKFSQTGVYGYSDDAAGVRGVAVNGTGVEGHSYYPTNNGPNGFAGSFYGAVNVSGPLYKSGGGFKIDHPLVPLKKYLNHSFVESSEMKNVYDGMVVLDRKGEAIIKVPDWFEALNRDFRYLLTAIGSAAPELHVAAEIQQGHFRIAGGRRGTKVSWQITGIRKDPWALANPLRVEETKIRGERGKYRHPEVHGKSDELSLRWLHHPHLLRNLQKRRKGKASLTETHLDAIHELLDEMKARESEVRRRGKADKKQSPPPQKPHSIPKPAKLSVQIANFGRSGLAAPRPQEESGVNTTSSRRTS